MGYETMQREYLEKKKIAKNMIDDFAVIVQARDISSGDVQKLEKDADALNGALEALQSRVRVELTNNRERKKQLLDDTGR